MKNFRHKLMILLIFFIMICIIIQPSKYSDLATEGILLWAKTVLPSLFPFIFLSTLLTKLSSFDIIINKFAKVTNSLFRCKGITLYVFLMSILAGYPVGAKIINDLHKKHHLTKDECTRMATLCSTSGPIFIIGAVCANLFNNSNLGYIMWIIHILSAILCGLIFRNYGIKTENTFLEPSRYSDDYLNDSIYSSVISILYVGASICLFYVLAGILEQVGILRLTQFILFPLIKNETYIKGLTIGLIECTSGCKILSSIRTNISASIASAIISVGGLSVIFQSVIFLKKTSCNIRIFIASKFIQGAISFTLTLITLLALNKLNYFFWD